MYDVAQLIREYPHINVMAGRGVRRWQEVVELLMAGATIVEMCTTAFVYGLGFGREMLDEIEKFMERKGYAAIDDLKGRRSRKCSSFRDQGEGAAGIRQGASRAMQSLRALRGSMRLRRAKVFSRGGAGMAKIDESKCVGCTSLQPGVSMRRIALQNRSVEEYLKAL
jgi:hypothetical protein